MVEVSTPNNNNNKKKKTVKSTHSLLLLAIRFTVCCNSNLSTYFSKSHYFSWNGCQIHPMVGTKHMNILPHTLPVVYSFPGHNQLLLVSQHAGKLPFTTRGLKNSQHTYHLHYRNFTEM